MTKDGKDIKSYLDSFLKEKTYFLKESTVGKSVGNSTSRTSNNPFMKDTLNLT
jgi:hypothetical protein